MVCRFIPVVLLAVCAFGCIQRTLTVESEPEGAAVYYDHRRVGETPLSLRFTHYGSHSLILIKEGFQPYRGRLALKEKGWAVFPVDLITEGVLPVKLKDDRQVRIVLSRAAPPGEPPALNDGAGAAEENEDPLPQR